MLLFWEEGHCINARVSLLLPTISQSNNLKQEVCCIERGKINITKCICHVGKLISHGIFVNPVHLCDIANKERFC